MTMENINDKFSIKNLLFKRAIPNNVIPATVTGHKVFSCTDCGDKFIFESSYEYHVNRKSVQITYMCRHCGKEQIFYNRCNLLSHIRSHSFKTATINVTDLNVEPLPLGHFKLTLESLANRAEATTPAALELSTADRQSSPTETVHKSTGVTTCHECKEDITFEGLAYIDRKRHFMEFTNEVYTCPVCLFALPTQCALKAHVRLHLKFSPYYCPECGVQLPNKNVQYPYNHDCDGFKMMRATARLKCPIVNKCSFFHPNDFKEHMKQNHLKKVYKCQLCVVACFSEVTMIKHLKIHKRDAKAVVFYQCELCPGRLVLQNHMDQHLKSHINTTVYPCWTCGAVCKNVRDLLCHHMKKHKDNLKTNQLLSSLIHENKVESGKQRIYRVVKRCDQCKRSFIYKCTYGEISVLPNVCPYKCSSGLQSKIESEGSQHGDSQLVCYMCKNEMSQDWEEIKKHFATFHKKYRCLDVKVQLTRLNTQKYLKELKSKKEKQTVNDSVKIQKNTKCRENSCELEIIDIVQRKPSSSDIADEQICKKCGHKCDSKCSLEQHMIIHRDPCMAYQCLECGQSFVVKPSFSTHLLLEHKITNVENYINTKQCYNENALSKLQQNEEINEPLCENQCTICREQFENTEDLEKHFRVHGMAFLMKNTTNKINIH